MNTRSLLIPLAVFITLAGFLAVGFTLKDPHLLPSQMINKPFPEFKLAELNDPGRVLTRKDITGQVSLVNVWATWCPNCAMENPEMMRIAMTQGIPIYGIDYNDDSAKAVKWLKQNGNPYRFNIVDNKGTLGIDLGVYGAPETFIVDADGVIQHRHVGPVDWEIFNTELLPIIKRLRTQAGQAGNS